MLKNFQLFQGLEESDLNKISQVTKERACPKGTVLFKEGDVGDAFYLIIEGGVEIVKTEKGQDKVIGNIESNSATNFFGEMALIAGAPRNATLRTSKESKFLVIEKSNFDMMLRLNSFIALRIMSALSQRFRAASGESAAEEKRGKVLAVFSPKSGSGKSAFSTNLATGLAKAGTKVLLVDLELQFGDLAFMLGVSAKRTIADLVEHPTDKFEVFKEYLSEHKDLGFCVLAAPLKPEQSETINSTHLRAILDLAKKTFDYIVLDLHSFFQDLTINAMDMADLIYLMMVPNMNHVKNMIVCLKVMENLKYSNEKIKLVINREGSQNSLSRPDIESALKRKVEFGLADDFNNVNALVEKQKTVFQLDIESPYKLSISKIVENLTGKNIAGTAAGGSLMGKIKGFFSN